MLDGLSLESDHDASKIGGSSPRTIKRPTNPVAMCLEENSWRLTPDHPLSGGTDDNIPFGAVAKRPRLGPCSLPLSPLSCGSSSNSHSAAPSNSPSAQTSPVHGMQPAFATRPQTNHEGLAEPRPILANFSAALPPPVTPFGTPPSVQAMPHWRSLSAPDMAGTFDATLGNSFSCCSEPVSDRTLRPPSLSDSPVAIATSSIRHNLRLDPALPNSFIRGPGSHSLLPPSLNGRGHAMGSVTIPVPIPVPSRPPRPSVDSSSSGGFLSTNGNLGSGPGSPCSGFVGSGSSVSGGADGGRGSARGGSESVSGRFGIGSTSCSTSIGSGPSNGGSAAALPSLFAPSVHASTSITTPQAPFAYSGGFAAS